MQQPGPGCFGTGPGKLDVTEGMFSVDPVHMPPGKYVLTVIVTKDTRMAKAEQILTVIDGNPIEVLVE